MRKILSGVVLGVAFVCGGPAMAADTRDHGAHEHGTARLDIALVGRELAIDLYSPAMNIVGFEHAPGNEAQRGELADALTVLGNAEGVFRMTDAAGCRELGSEVMRVAGDDHEERDGHADGAHSEIQARYRYECSAPAALERIQVRLFELFPATGRIRVQMLTDTAQRAMVLVPENPHVPF